MNKSAQRSIKQAQQQQLRYNEGASAWQYQQDIDRQRANRGDARGPFPFRIFFFAALFLSIGLLGGPPIALVPAFVFFVAGILGAKFR